jgi:CRP/FNR family transcriptional regulator, cyclic AMP receptor protein
MRQIPAVTKSEQLQTEAALAACPRLDILHAMVFSTMVVELDPRIVPNFKNLAPVSRAPVPNPYGLKDLEISLGGHSPINRRLTTCRGQVAPPSRGVVSAISAHRIVGCGDGDCLQGARSRLKHVLDDLFREPKITRVPKGQTACMEGQPAETLFLIQDGLIKLSLFSIDGTESVPEILGKGDCFGEECAADGRPHYAETATALTSSAVARVPRPNLLRKLSEEPDLAKMYISALVHRVHEYEERFAQHVFENSEQRLVRVLARVSKFGEWVDENTVLLPHLTHETLSEMVGTTRPRITYFLGKFERLGILRSGPFLCVNVQKLGEVLKLPLI